MKKTPEIILLSIFVLVSTLGMLKGGAWAAIALGGAGALVVALWAQYKEFPWPNQKTGFFVLAFLAVAGGLALVSPFQDKALYSTLKLASIFLPLVFFSSPQFLKVGRILWVRRAALGNILALGFVFLSGAIVVASALYGYESEPITKLNRGLSYGLLLSMPLLAVTLAESKKRGFVLLGAMVMGVVFTHSRTSQAAAAVATGVFVLAYFWPVMTRRLLAFGMTLSILWPFFAKIMFADYRELVFKLPSSLVARVEIWDYLAHRIAEKPLLGWGLGSSPLLDWATPNGQLYKFTILQAAHPHNAIVQLWVEMGILGLLAGFLACFWLLKGVKKLDAPMVPYALAGLALGFVLLLSAYNLWTDSLWAAMALTVFLFASFSGDKIKVSLSANPQDIADPR